MGMFDRFNKPPATTTYRIANQDKAIRVLSQSDDTLDTSILTEIMTGTFQSVNSLSGRMNVNRDKIQRSLSRLSGAGLIAPVKS